MGVSCDSFDVETNLKIGRSQNGKGVHTKKVFQVADWCKDRGIMFKLNSVIGLHNWEEDMNDGIDEIAPFRWKVRPLKRIVRRITTCSQ
jgi:radical S-adenosyl methionine domain-containing protein 2